jgi:hypothetical protein
MSDPRESGFPSPAPWMTHYTILTVDLN